MFVTQAHYNLIVDRMRQAEERALALEGELKIERERNRQHEEALIDRVLVRHNSRPVSPPEPMPAPQPAMSALDVARLQDRLKEELEHRGADPGNLTPDVRVQLDEWLEDISEQSRMT
jgi:hypothetical protein